MTNFKYKALNNVNELIEGEIEAIDARNAREKIRELGLIPTKVSAQDDYDIDKRPAIRKESVNNLSLNNKIFFTSGLQDLLSSGIPIMEALDILEKNNRDFKLRAICEKLQKAIYTGMTFSDALEYLFKDVFGDVYIGLVKAGETSGKLEATLERILVLLKKQAYIKSRIIRASIYPGFLCSLLVLVLPVFAVLVYPSFQAVYREHGADMPLISQTFFGTLQFISNFWGLILIIIAAGIGAMIMLLKNPDTKAKIDAFLLKIPKISDFIQYLNLANYMTVLFISYEAGVPLPSGMELANKTIKNYKIKSKMEKASSLARKGNTLEKSYSETKALPSVFFSMISISEKSGTLSKAFRDISVTIDKRLEIAIDATMSALKHLAMIILAIIIGFTYAAFMFAYTGMLGTLL